ncbi:hypothetical protein K7432_016793 [Basidiobolus ranarum]|uniref:D-isomer specific 2-hydroxyacid dehydrogenase NAD-binding domain-containing protein n=1 Tax=Basidiobolus ranarum TaxID=34480 RepID=A0ABR2VL55_9FUNG
MTNKTLGVVGLGCIGEASAICLKALGISHVLYTGRHERKEQASKLNAEFTDFDTLLKESDVLIVCCALTEDTREIFNYDAFKKMKSNVIFVNTARGDIVQQDDLVRALEENLVGGVGLDVATPEPLPVDHPLFKCKKRVILPYIGSGTVETRGAMGYIAIDNLAWRERSFLSQSKIEQYGIFRKYRYTCYRINIPVVYFDLSGFGVIRVTYTLITILSQV